MVRPVWARARSASGSARTEAFGLQPVGLGPAHGCHDTARAPGATPPFRFCPEVVVGGSEPSGGPLGPPDSELSSSSVACWEQRKGELKETRWQKNREARDFEYDWQERQKGLKYGMVVEIFTNGKVFTLSTNGDTVLDTVHVPGAYNSPLVPRPNRWFDPVFFILFTMMRSLSTM